jgi:hypothetical protein
MRCCFNAAVRGTLKLVFPETSNAGSDLRDAEAATLTVTVTNKLLLLYEYVHRSSTEE